MSLHSSGDLTGIVPLTVETLANRYGGRVAGDGSLPITGLAPLDSATVEQLAFLSNPLYLRQAADSQAAAVVISARDLEKLGDTEARTWIISPNPYAFFARVGLEFARRSQVPRVPGIAATAVVAPDAVVPASCHLGPGVVVEAGAVLGERVTLLANIHVGRGATIGDDTLVYPNVSIYHECVTGARCILHSGAVIGADGFGFAPDFGPQGGEWVKIPQVGRAVLGDDVEIGANTTIDRGAMADTVIEQGCKLDNQVQIAHNVRIGAHTVIAGCSGIAGSTKIGRYCVIGGSVNFVGHLTIADRVTVSGGTTITKSIGAAGHFSGLFPFMPHAEWERNAAILRGLGKLRERLRRLETLFKNS